MESDRTEALSALDRSQRLVRRQRFREQYLIESDRGAIMVEAARIAAEEAASDGRFASLQDAVVSPTDQWLAKGEVEPYTPRARDGSAKAVSTVRRRSFDAVRHMQGRGILDEGQSGACRWFSDLYQAAEIEGTSGIASYGETIRGDIMFGHLPRSAWAAQARSDYRQANAAIAERARKPFHMVIINNVPVRRAAIRFNRRPSAIQALVIDGADALVRFIDARDRAIRAELGFHQMRATDD